MGGLRRTMSAGSISKTPARASPTHRAACATRASASPRIQTGSLRFGSRRIGAGPWPLCCAPKFHSPNRSHPTAGAVLSAVAGRCVRRKSDRRARRVRGVRLPSLRAVSGRDGWRGRCGGGAKGLRGASGRARGGLPRLVRTVGAPPRARFGRRAARDGCPARATGADERLPPPALLALRQVPACQRLAPRHVAGARTGVGRGAGSLERWDERLPL